MRQGASMSRLKTPIVIGSLIVLLGLVASFSAAAQRAPVRLRRDPTELGLHMPTVVKRVRKRGR